MQPFRADLCVEVVPGVLESGHRLGSQLCAQGDDEVVGMEGSGRLA